jgi:hypothetical protein
MILKTLPARPATHWCISSVTISGAGIIDGVPQGTALVTLTGWPSLEAMLAPTGAPEQVRTYTIEGPASEMTMAGMEAWVIAHDADFSEGEIV